MHALQAIPAGDLSNSAAEVWSLFSDRAKIENKMTEQLRLNIAIYEAAMAQAAAEAAAA